MSGSEGRTRLPVLLALLALSSTLALQTILVGDLHCGEPSGPFLIGERSHPPVERWPLEVVSDANGYGYDGQYFLMLALDPWGTEGVRAGLDLPEYRSRRILLPALSRLAGLGNPDWIVLAFYVWIAAFGALGVWSVAHWAIDRGGSPWWGLTWVAQLGVVISVWRMLPDGMAAALLVSAVLAASRRREGLAAVALALAVLTKETLLLAILGFVAAALARRRWRSAAIYLAAALPAVVWWWAVRRTLGDDSGVPLASNFSWPMAGLLDGLRELRTDPRAQRHTLRDLACVATYSAAMILGPVLAVRAWIRRRSLLPGELEAAFTWLLYSALGVVLSYSVWIGSWAYGRVLLPLPVLALLFGLSGRRADGLRWVALALAVAAAGLGLLFLDYLLRYGNV